jgi:hypothetical protein
MANPAPGGIVAFLASLPGWMFQSRIREDGKDRYLTVSHRSGETMRLLYSSFLVLFEKGEENGQAKRFQP